MEPEGIVLLRYIRDEVSDEERVWIEGWLKEDERNKKILQQTARIYFAIHTQQRILSRDPMAAFGKVSNQIKSRSGRIWLRRIGVAAACFAGILLLSSALSFWRTQHDEAIEPQLMTVCANAGMRTHFNLPDGSVVYLNSGSILSYPFPFDKGERRVVLSGEGYFKVAHNSQQPFLVSVCDDRMQIEVLGTEFNLQAYEGDTKIGTTLISGSVLLKLRKDHKTIQEMKLNPSEKAVFDSKSGNVSIQTVNTEYETAWKEGRLMFKDMPLPHVLKKLSYFYNVKFQVQDPVINSYCFTGIFENKQLFQVMEYLKISSQMDYDIRHVTADDSLKTQYTTVILKKKK